MWGIRKLFCVAVALPVVLFGHIVNYKPKSITDVKDFSEKNPDAVSVRRVSSNRELKIDMLSEVPKAWTKLAQKTDSDAKVYLLEKDNEIGLVFDGNLFVFGDINHLTADDIKLTIYFLTETVRDIDVGLVATNFWNAKLVRK